jgi:hypothetical protein
MTCQRRLIAQEARTVCQQWRQTTGSTAENWPPVAECRGNPLTSGRHVCEVELGSSQHEEAFVSRASTITSLQTTQTDLATRS